MSNNFNPYDYYTYPTAPFVQPPRRKKPVVRIFLVIVLLVGLGTGVAYFTTNSVPGQTTGATTEEGQNFGFSIQPNDPLFAQQYALQRIEAQDAWEVTQGRSGIIVAVIDTGIDADHPDLKGKLVKGYDFLDNDTTPEDTVGHGTFVASLIAANNNDEVGISGVAPGVKIMPLKVLSGKNNASSYTIARAIRYAVDNGAKVINMSLGSPAASRYIKSAVEYAINKNVVVVAASGNEGNEENYPNYPASFEGVISVGATTSRDTIASFSTYNSGVNISAPGSNVIGARSSINQICRPYRTNDYCVASGTSFASPYVAGAAALVLSVNPNLTPAQVESILENSAQDLGTKGKDNYYGYGRLDVAKAVEAAQLVA